MRKIDETFPPDTVELIDAFVRYQRAKGIRSIRKIPYCLTVYFVWLGDRGLSVADVTPLMAEEFQAYLVTLEDEHGVHYATRTVADIVKIVNGLHVWLVETQATTLNPFHRMPRVKETHSLPRDIPTVSELRERLESIRTFWTAAKVRDRRNLYRLHVIAELLYATGIRLNELAHLKETDIDWDHNLIHIRVAKGGMRRYAFLNEYAAQVLRIYVTTMRNVVNWNQGSEHLFGTLSGRNIDTWLNKHLKETLGFTSHTFRHTVGTHLLKSGCDLRFIQAILGHEDLDSTSVYTKVEKEDLRTQLDIFHPRRGNDVDRAAKSSRGKR